MIFLLKAKVFTNRNHYDKLKLHYSLGVS